MIVLSFKSYLPCLLAPCQNNGVCSPGPNGTVLCNCTTCYGGPLCQNIDYCCLNVCGPNGLCLSGLNNSYTCICQAGFTGKSLKNATWSGRRFALFFSVQTVPSSMLAPPILVSSGELAYLPAAIPFFVSVQRISLVLSAISRCVRLIHVREIEYLWDLWLREYYFRP